MSGNPDRQRLLTEVMRGIIRDYILAAYDTLMFDKAFQKMTKKERNEFMTDLVTNAHIEARMIINDKKD